MKTCGSLGSTCPRSPSRQCHDSYNCHRPTTNSSEASAMIPDVTEPASDTAIPDASIPDSRGPDALMPEVGEPSGSRTADRKSRSARATAHGVSNTGVKNTDAGRDAASVEAGGGDGVAGGQSGAPAIGAERDDVEQLTLPVETAGTLEVSETVAVPARRLLAIGAVEAIDYRHILGWAWSPPTPNEPIEVEILVDDAVVVKAQADLPRRDLAELGAGDGRHGFLIHNLAAHVPPGTHNVRVRRARDRLDIPGSPSTVTRPEPPGMKPGPGDTAGENEAPRETVKRGKTVGPGETVKQGETVEPGQTVEQDG